MPDTSGIMGMMDNPFVFGLVTTLSLASGSLLWKGLKNRSIPFAIYGLGLGIPTFAVKDPDYWLFGGALVGAGYFLSKRLG